MTPEHRVAEAVRDLAERGVAGPFVAVIVLGTGLGGLVDDVEAPTIVPYGEIAHFPVTSVTGHAGRVVAGRIGASRVLLLAGRAHVYESGDAAAMAVPIGTAAALGARLCLLSSASGGLSPGFDPGTLVAVSDHIGIGLPNPLVGLAGDRRFVSMTQAYEPALRVSLRRAADIAGIPFREGVYMWFGGPSFETPAEIRAAGALGADIVGMSTVPETILARYHGLPVAAVSLVTNKAAGLAPGDLSHEETKRVADAASGRFRQLVTTFLAELPAA